MDARTRKYIRALNNAREAEYKAVQAAEQICNCENCIEARARKKTLSECEQAKIMNTIHEGVIGSMPSNFHPELSPNYFDNKSTRMSRRAF